MIGEVQKMLVHIILSNLLLIIKNRIYSIVYIASIFIPIIICLNYYYNKIPINDSTYVPKCLRKKGYRYLISRCQEVISNLVDRLINYAEASQCTPRDRGSSPKVNKQLRVNKKGLILAAFSAIVLQAKVTY